MVSPHFPPDSNAGTHRVRLLAPRLHEHGWLPTVVSVDPRDYEGRLDASLAAMVPVDLDVVRCRALPAAVTRTLGVGDLGLRSLPGLYRTCARLLAERRYDALFITIYPAYPALLGPILKRRYGVPFVLDYQDPWVGEWGLSVGPGPGGRPNLKSRLSRLVAQTLEPQVTRAVDAITAVSAGTYEAVHARHPELRHRPAAAIPIGFEPSEFASPRAAARDRLGGKDGAIHLCYVGTILPLAVETVRALLAALALLRQQEPHLGERIRLHFFGTSNVFDADAPPRVLPLADEIGVKDAVTEEAPRIDYLDAVSVQAQATALLILGSSEPHYTASKIFPALASARPLLALCHRESSVASILQRAARAPSVQLITFDSTASLRDSVPRIAAALASLAREPRYDRSEVDWTVLEEFTARALAGRLAQVLSAASGS
jgi:hypothetical protein